MSYLEEDWAPDEPEVAPLAVPPEVIAAKLGPDAIVRTDGPTVIGPCNSLEIAPTTREGIRKLEEELGVEWASGDRDVPLANFDPDTPLMASADLPPMSQWKEPTGDDLSV